MSGAIIVDLQRCKRSGARQGGKSHPEKQLNYYHWLLILHYCNNTSIANNTNNRVMIVGSISAAQMSQLEASA